MTREIALLTNPVSGRGRALRRAEVARQRLHEAGFAVREIRGRSAEETRDLASLAVAEGPDALVVCGGDGTVHLAVQALAGTTVPLGIIPAGTGDDVARYLGIPRHDPRQAADVVVASRVRTIDLARAAGRYLVTVLAAGFDARVNERANAMTWPTGQMRYNLATLAELRVLGPIPYTLQLDDRTVSLEAVMVAVGNGPTYGGGLRMCEGAELDDGALDVVVIRPINRRQLVRTYPRLFSGRHRSHPAYEHHRVRRVTVAAPAVVAYADGERLGPLPLTVEVVPGALRVLSRT